MQRKWLSVAMLAIGAGLLVAAGFASPASSRNAKAGAAKAGGTLRLSKSTDIDYVDPALAYFGDSWELEYITCAKLFNYPDKTGAAGAQVVPEMVQNYKISKNGKTYTFVLRKTYKYNTGRTVGPVDFQNTFLRNADPKMQSPATAYMHEIIGVDAVLDGKAQTASGIVAKGNTLTIKLSKPLPDFLSRLTMPFFCPLPPGTPHDSDGINNPPGSGPYYISSRQVNRQLIIKRNPNYKGPRPHNVDQIVWTIGPTLEACRLQTEQNQVDYCVDGVPPATYKEIADKYGIKGATGKGQFFFNTLLATSYFALNNNTAFKGNLNLRKAVNNAIDRPALVRAGGYLGGKRTDQILPPAMTKDANIYPIKGANPAAAKKLAAGHMPPGNKLTLYTANRGARVIRAQVFQFNMKQIGIDVNVTQFARAVQHAKCGTLNEPFDVCDEGWIVDYADPVTFFEPLLLGTNIHDTENTNEAYFNDPKFNKAIVAAGNLSGAARSKAYAALDIGMTKDAAPWASFLTLTNRDFVSKSTGCYLFHPVFLMDWAVTCKT